MKIRNYLSSVDVAFKGSVSLVLSVKLKSQIMQNLIQLDNCTSDHVISLHSGSRHIYRI